MSWQWTYIERTLNMQWTRHRTLRKLRERANRWKSKENSIFVFFLKITINCTDLLLFAAFWTVFNVCSMLRSLYVHCMFNVSFHQKLNLTRDDTPVTLSDPTYPMLSRHTTYLDTPDWPGLFPSYLSLCAGAWSMVACSEWVCWMWMWPAGRKQKEMLFRDGTLSKVLSLQQLQRQSCKGGLQNTACYASHAFLHRPHTFYDRYHALAMSWQWTYIERTLNMQWTRHRTLRKLRERANRWKSKENSIFVFFLKITINCTDLLLFAAFWTVFNVCSMLRSLYVHCMFNVSFHQKLNLTRDDTPVTLSDPTYPMLSRHTTYLDTPDWPGLFPSYLSLCAGAWSMVACSEWVCWMWMWPAGRKQKEMLFRDGTLSKVLSLQQLQRQSCKGGLQNTACYASHAFLHRPHTFYDRYHALAMSWQWTYIERTLNMQWTRHRTLRKLRERANRWKSKENSIFVFFLKITINCTDLLLFAAFWTVFNVCSMLRSLYVHCMFNVSFHQKLNLTRDDTPVTLSDPTYPMLSRHTTYLDTPDWPGLFPSYLSLCAGAWSMVACSEWVCWMWMWPAGRKQKEMLFRDGTLSKVLSLQQLQRQSCKGGLQNTACYASHAFLHRPHTFYDRYHALAMSWQWTYIERTLNMQWTRHRTLRKLRERANRWKSKENSIFVFFLKITINCTDLLLFAAFWTVFNVCSMLRSLYVHCMFNVSFHQKLNLTRDDTPVTLSDPTYPMLSRHTTYLDTPDWPGLFPSYLSLCAGAWSMVACSEWVCWMWMWPAGRKQKEMLFRDGWWTKSCTST